MSTQLTPIAQSWGYLENPLEQSIKGPPMVLILGNYSSGKSTLINDLLGQEVQKTGQAPTDDCFTVLTYGEESPTSSSYRAAGENESFEKGNQNPIPMEQEGQMLLQNEAYPFAPLKKHGQKFASHFRMKRVGSPFLKNLMLIDTPGMIDSVSERDRGYDYQSVIADLAQLADLVLVLFDPHKAGTLRESHESLRETLPQATFENRVVFVLNRTDECQTLADLLRVYGVLCWNLSQMLGRKDIPPIRISYSQRITNVPDYLKSLDHERTHLGELISSAPLLRQDHLRSFARLHAERMQFMLRTLSVYCKDRQKARLKSLGRWTIAAASLGVALFLWCLIQLAQSIDVAGLAGALGFLAIIFFWILGVRGWVSKWFHHRAMRHFDQWVPIKNQNDRDIWLQVKKRVEDHLGPSLPPISASTLKKDLKTLDYLLDKGLKV